MFIQGTLSLYYVQCLHCRSLSKCPQGLVHIKHDKTCVLSSVELKATFLIFMREGTPAKLSSFPKAAEM